MLIPSIDLMAGKIVQLVQGEKKALEFDDFEEWIIRFAGFPLVQLIDLDAAIGTGSNRALLGKFTNRLPCQVGGGIRSWEDGAECLANGAHRIILGSALIRDGSINIPAARQFARKAGGGRKHRCRFQGRKSRDQGLARSDFDRSLGHAASSRALLHGFPVHAHRYGGPSQRHSTRYGQPPAQADIPKAHCCRRHSQPGRSQSTGRAGHRCGGWNGNLFRADEARWDSGLNRKHVRRARFQFRGR